MYGNATSAIHYAPVAMGIIGLVTAALIFFRVRALPVGEGKPRAIAEAIHRGALVFTRRQYAILAVFATAVFAGLAAALGISTALAFGFGALCSAAAGFTGMYTATQANVRTTLAAHNHGLSAALRVAFAGGSTMGITVASMGLLGLGVLYLIFAGDPHSLSAINGFGMGASSVALFARVGGGIYTKSADVGADLVGKVEAGIPEDDPRNPGVIADNVGDNVGDIAGMGSDIFESYVGSIIATIAIAAAAPAASLEGNGTRGTLILLPLILCTAGLFCTLIGIAAVELAPRRSPGAALSGGMVGTAVLFMAAAYGVTTWLDVSHAIWGAVLAGTISGIVIGLATQYYTGAGPVRDLANAGQTGPATVLISGLALGLRSVVAPLLAISAAIFAANHLAGLYGVAVAAVGMLSTVGMIMAIDAYGPVADNAGGIAEMAGLGEDTRRITDALDEVGNTTAAIGKGFAIGAAALTALALITAFVETISIKRPDFGLSLNDPEVLVGLFIGGAVPFLIAALTMTAVGDAAFQIIQEIRRQFHEIPGLLEGKAEPDSDRCVDIATRAAVRKMAAPALVAVSTPIVIGFVLGPAALGGLLAGALVAGVLLALTMANAGGAWDNAKKYVEQGHFGGKGSETHKACVVGDTVGDPFKDTSGPSMNILIKLMAIVSLVIAPLL